MKKYAYFIIIFVVALTAFTYIYSKELKEDIKETKQVMENIKKNYQTFNSSVEAFAAKREEYYTYRQNTYIESFASNIDGWNKLMKDYTDIMIKIKQNTKYLTKYCNQKYSDATVNNDCTQFKANYEAANNYYITDIKGYNKVVEEYNALAENYNYQKLKKVDLKNMKYIDLDEDGKYFGKSRVR